MRLTSLETTDIFRGAFIICMGGALESIRFDKTRKGIASFIFTGEDLPKYDRDYINGHALVNPLQFREALNTLRDILFNNLRKTKSASAHRYRSKDTRYDRTRDYREPQARY